MATYGYVRVSTREQNVNRQLDALRAFPIDETHIYIDHYTGADFERPAYRRMLKRLRRGDTLVVKSIDRLGRNYTEILNQWRALTQERKVAMVVLDMPLLDTRVAHGDLTGTFIADIVLQLLSYIAQVERENIHQRQAEGIAAARARGTRFGRPRIQRPTEYPEVKAAFQRRELTAAQAGERLGVCRATFENWMRRDREECFEESSSANLSTAVAPQPRKRLLSAQKSPLSVHTAALPS